MTIEAKLGLDVFKLDKQPHIAIDHALCSGACPLQPCLVVCPAHVYVRDAAGAIQPSNWEGCLECGTCVIVCQAKALTWHYPRSGFGVQYRFG